LQEPVLEKLRSENQEEEMNYGSRRKRRRRKKRRKRNGKKIVTFLGWRTKTS